MKRRDLFRQVIDKKLPDRKEMLHSILSEAPVPPPHRFPGKRAAAAVLAAVLLVAGFGTLYYLLGRASQQQPKVVEIAQLHLFAAGNTAMPESATELEPNIECQLPMWGTWHDDDPAGAAGGLSILKEQRSSLGIRGEGLRSYTISCDNGRLVYCPDSYPRLLEWMAQSDGQPAESRYMSCIFLPAEISFQEAMTHAQAGDAAYFENILKAGSYQTLRNRYFGGAEIRLNGTSFSALQSDAGGAILSVLRADWEEDPLPQLSGQSITVLRPQEGAGINWEPDEQDYRKLYEPGPFAYADFGSATITVTAHFEDGKQVVKHLFVYFSEDGYQTVKLLD